MKKLDKYILKSFLKPFLATFFIILFVLVMQALWMAFDHFAGKGIGIGFILKFLWYTMLLVAPQAFPIGVLLSSIMTLGSLSENYEFAAMKSAGISLKRIIKPLLFFTLFLSIVNFMFLNYVYPYAMLKQINLKMNVKTKEPALALIPGSFNSEIPNYQIKFDEKYGEEENLLKNVMIYDLSSNRGNNKIITAKKGELVSEEGSRYLTLILKDGNFFENHINNNTPYKKRQKMPASYADFKEYIINIDISSFSNDDLDDLKYTKNFNMLSLAQLQDTLPDMKLNYDEYINSRAKNLYINIDAEDLYKQPDSLVKKNLSPVVLDNFKPEQKINILNTAISKVERTLDNIKSNRDIFKYKRKVLNHYDIEFYNRIALSLACLLLFFIGAPLGSIIRKGGMGLPMILAILIYVTFHFSNTFGRNMAEESSLTAVTGSWLSFALMLPLAIFFTVRATNDKGLANIGLQKFLNVFILKIKKYFLKEEKLYQYDIPLTKQYINNNSSKFLNLDNKQLIDIVRNFHQYGYNKQERQLALNILSEKETDFDFLKNSGKLENKKYQKMRNAFKEFKLITNTALIFWIFTFLLGLFLGKAGIIAIVVWIAIQIVYISLLIEVYKTYEKLNINIDGKPKYNTALFFVGGLSFYIIINYLIVSEIKDKIKNIT